MKNISNKIAIALAALALLASGCRKDKLKYDIPTSYSFDNVNYSGQSDRLSMMSELSTYMKSAHTPGTVLDLQRLRDMYENANNPFSFVSSKQLKDKTFLATQGTIENYFVQLANASQSTVPGADGTAGVVYSLDSSKNYLFDANGWEYAQLVEKGLMGALCYYQATGVYLAVSKIGEDQVDNETITPGEGTAMQHHWDEAFGYLGVSKEFPVSTSGLRFWGKYANDRDGLIKCNDSLMIAFITGRAAINNDDHDTKWKQVDIIRRNWENVIAATAIHYLNEGKADATDDALRNHALSEAVAFIDALRYNPDKRITDTQVNDIIGGLGNNLYQVTLASLDNARNTLASIYGFTNIKDQL